MRNLRILAILLCGFIQNATAQSQQGDLIRIMVSPAKNDMVYAVGEDVIFEIAIYKFGHLLNNVEIEYKIGPEKMEPRLTKKMLLTDGRWTAQAGGLDSPGFLTCQVFVELDGKTYMNSGTAAIDPEKIQPTTTLPDDFTEFWESGKKELSLIPIEAEVTLMPDRCSALTNAYHVRIKNVNGYMYGILTMPKAPGKYPAILHVPGAGVRPYYPHLTDKPVISLQIGIHGVPVNLYDSNLYGDLGSGPLRGYNTANLDDRDNYYYKRVYLGCIRAVDFIYSLPEFDGENLGVMGGSQGGALSIITTGLDDRIDYLVSFYPALSDMTGYLYGRAGGWPHLFQNESTNTKEKIETSKYFDVVNFARNVKVPGYYSFGFNDNVCPPTSIYSALNVVKGTKKIELFHDAAHWRYAEQSEEATDWIYEQLNIK